MRILVFSDTHGQLDRCRRLLRTIPEVDMALHAGDHAQDAEILEKDYPGILFHYVRGNCDFSSAPGESVIEADGKRIFLTHGHCYHVKYDEKYQAILQKARKEKANLAVFGHTHIPYDQHYGDLILLNPGSLTYSGTYGVVEIENGKLRAAVCKCP